jgi:chitin disaccharide deacetylase
MLIINADDFGRNIAATDNTLKAFRRGTVTSASAMVFMDDSERAAQLAFEAGLEVGLHLNLSAPFSVSVPSSLDAIQERIGSFLLRSRYSKMVYNPFVSLQFEYVFGSQYDEFIRIYGKKPSHIDGHHHLHLCANMVLGNVIPVGSIVRRNYTYFRGDKPWLNRFYRKAMDAYLRLSHACTDYFFALPKKNQLERLPAILALADKSSVELMAHPEKAEDFSLLMSDEFVQMLGGIRLATHADIKNMRNRIHKKEIL